MMQGSDKYYLHYDQGFSGGDSNLYGYILQDLVNFIDSTDDNINQNNWSEPLISESYLANYEQIERERRERVRSQLDASCDIGQELTGDILTRGIPFGPKTETAVGMIYEEAH